MRQRYDQLSNIRDQTKEQLELLKKEKTTLNDIQNRHKQRILSMQHDQRKSNDTVYQLHFERETWREDIEQWETHLDEHIRQEHERYDKLRDDHQQHDEQLQLLSEANSL